MTEPALAVRDLRVWYGSTRGPVRAVDGVSFDVWPGEMLGLVGESGCGKTTLARSVLRLLPERTAIDGEVWLRGENLVGGRARDLRALRGAELGLIFQEPMTRLDPLMRICDHFAETLRAHQPSLARADIERRSLETLRGMGIPPTRFRDYPHEFSGGMRQRIMIALALVLRPAVVIADEPTTALDVLVEAQILRILADLKANFDAAMLLITHNVALVAESCERVAVMYAGRIVEQGSTADIFTEPRHPYTRELLRSTISLSTTELRHIPGAPPDLASPPAGCRFHPRCPDAMVVCESREPPEVGSRETGQAACWLRAAPGQIPAGGDAPLLREAISVAEEA